MMSAIRLLGSFPLRLLLPDFTRLCHTRSAGERGAHFSYGDDLRVERATVVAGVDRGPDRLDLVDKHRTGRAPPTGKVARPARCIARTPAAHHRQPPPATRTGAH